MGGVMELISKEAAIALMEAQASAKEDVARNFRGGSNPHHTRMAEAHLIRSVASAIRALPAQAPALKVRPLIDAVEALTRRKEPLGGQMFSYVKLEDVISILAAIEPAQGGEAQVTAVKVRKLEWVKSHIKPWSEDWHTTSTGYTIRCADEWGWKWSNSVGTHGHERGPEAAKSAAQQDYESRILAALDLI